MQFVDSVCPYCDGSMFSTFDFENDQVYMRCNECGCESPKVYISSDMLKESVVKKYINNFLEAKFKKNEKLVKASLNKINGIDKEGEENE